MDKREENKWISVKNRLPECITPSTNYEGLFSDKVLVHYSHGAIETTFGRMDDWNVDGMRKFKQQSATFKWGVTGNMKNVTHWMRLPKSPIGLQNDPVSDTTKVESSTEAGIKNSPSWKEILEKEAKERFPVYPGTQSEIEFIDGMNRAKDYYEKEVVEPLNVLVRQIERLRKLDAANAIDDFNFFRNKKESEISELQQERNKL